MTSHRGTRDSVHFSPSDDAVEALLRFGVAMLRAGNTAARTHEWIEVVAQKLAFESVSISQSLDSLIVTVRRSGDWITVMREIGPPAVNVSRIGDLERLAKTVEAGSAPRDIANKLAKLESEPPAYSAWLIAVAVGVASGRFAFINGAAAVAAAVAGATGQWFRTWLLRNRYNQYGAAALTALTASGAYVLLAALMRNVGLEIVNFPAGFMGSVLFLVPGFPLVGGLFDLLQYKIVAGVSRLAYGTMILLAVALGLSIVIAIAGIDLSRQPPPELAYSLTLLLRAVASFVAGGAFAMLFNGSARTVLAAGLLALCANSFRLALTEAGMMLAPAAFFAAFVIGLVAVLADQRYNVPRILHKKRDEFQKAAKKQADAGEEAWLHTKSQLEGTWSGFETEVKKYVETFGKQIQQQQTTFQDAAAAQLTAWRDAAETIQTAATGLAMHRRSDIDAAVTRMKADASKAEANLQELNRAGTESWAP